ncbi:hypothetical protein Dsin_001251 [Dipteronia sinensis]|uniref:Zinc knuckle CX2CX4HX4C domain-containing protein n=1 Tax=Dipteronia sinensis TaxID=43782 RepID=A0AAE0B4Y1_9ROSI|nr:hypothetical protein Dsin_001251 [Dipteronia sinensis]
MSREVWILRRWCIISVFHNRDPRDECTVMAVGLWSFDNAFIVFEEPEGRGDIQGSIIGDVKEIDGGESGVCMGKFLRVCVAIEVDKPLRRFLRIDVLGDGVEFVMLLKYERLPEFCFRYGLIGHVTRECSEGSADFEKVDDDDLAFGFRLKASSLMKKTNY